MPKSNSVSDSLNFEAILMPITKKHFFQKYWGKNYLYIANNDEGFAHLLPWHELNKILTEHRLEEPRLRLAKGGQTIPSSEYSTQTRLRRGNLASKIQPENFNRKLAEGSTLIIDAIEEIHEPIKALALEFENVFDVSVQVNMYLGFGHTTGFSTHWDDHDVFIIQLQGRKKWYIYGETRKAPLYKDFSTEQNAPKKPIWTKTIRQGDVIYIPRGWWHNAIPCNEASLHLTIGINNKTGIDLYNFLLEKLLQDEFFRNDIPYFTSTDLNDYINKFRTKINVLINDEIVKDYLAANNNAASLRPRFSLPYSVQNKSELDPNTIISLSIVRRTDLKINSGEKSLSFSANSKKWSFSIQTEAFFKFLFENGNCTVQEALNCCPEIASKDFVVFLQELLSKGLIYIKG